MANGLILMALGVGLFWSAPAYSDVVGEFDRARARRAREEGWSRPARWMARWNVRFGAGTPGAALVGRLVGVAVALTGMGLVIASVV